MVLRLLSRRKQIICLLIDNSTSIELSSEKELMRQATRLFIEVLEEGDKLAIISFSDSATVLFNHELPRLDKRAVLTHSVSKKLTFEVHQSNITAAFECAAALGPTFWRDKDKFGKDVPHILILISDGRLYVEQTKSIPSRYRRLQALLDSSFQGVSIHSLEIKNQGGEGTADPRS